MNSIRCEMELNPNVFRFSSSLAASFKLNKSRFPRTQSSAGLPKMLRILYARESDGRRLARMLDVSEMIMLDEPKVSSMAGCATSRRKGERKD